MGKGAYCQILQSEFDLRTHMVERENDSAKLSSKLYAYTGHIHMHTCYINKCTKKKDKKKYLSKVGM